MGYDVCFPRGARWAETLIAVKTRRMIDPNSPAMETQDRLDLGILRDVLVLVLP